MLNRISILFLFACILFSCKTRLVNPETVLPSSDSLPVKTTSTIALPVSVSYGQLQHQINAVLTDVLYEDLSYENNQSDNLMVRILRKDSIRVKGAANQLQLQAPLQIWLLYRLKTNILGFPVEKIIEKEFHAMVQINSMIDLNAQWKLSSQTNTDIDTRLLPEANIAGLKIDLNQLLEPIITAQEKRIARLIDERLPGLIDVKSLIEEQWKAMQQPILLDSGYKAWLITNPERIYLSEINYRKQDAVFGLTLLLNAEIRTSETKPLISSKNLPPLQRSKMIAQGFAVYMPVQLFYNQLSASLNKQMAEKWYTFNQDKHQLYVEQFSIFPDKGRLGISLRFHGVSGKGLFRKKMKGTLFFNCTPYYDSASKTLYFKEVEYSLQTRDVLLKSASWILQAGLLRHSIEKNLNLPLDKQLQQLSQLAEKAINIAPAPNLSLRGSLHSLDIGGIRMLKESVVIYLKAEGKVFLEFR